jgi:hypothetical protein
MTESLLMGLCLLGITLTWRWVVQQGARRTWAPGIVLALACLTRYEAWPITVAALVLALVALVRSGTATKTAVGRVAVLATFPAAAVLAFTVLSRLTVGRWLVTGGFFELDQSMYQQPTAVVQAVWFGVRRLNGNVMTVLSVMGLIALLVSIVRARHASHLLVVLSIAACVALPLYAFWHGHPFRIRYMVPLTMSLAMFAGLGVGLLPPKAGTFSRGSAGNRRDFWRASRANVEAAVWRCTDARSPRDGVCVAATSADSLALALTSGRSSSCRPSRRSVAPASSFCMASRSRGSMGPIQSD